MWGAFLVSPRTNRRVAGLFSPITWYKGRECRDAPRGRLLSHAPSELPRSLPGAEGSGWGGKKSPWGSDSLGGFSLPWGCGMWVLSLVLVLCVMWRNLASSHHQHLWALSPRTPCCPPPLPLLFWVGWDGMGWVAALPQRWSVCSQLLAGEASWWQGWRQDGSGQISRGVHKGLKHWTSRARGLAAWCWHHAGDSFRPALTCRRGGKRALSPPTRTKTRAGVARNPVC